MSQDFGAMASRMAAQIPLERFKQEQLDACETGRLFASEFIEAARTGTMPVDGLMCAVTLVGKTGKHNDCVMRGFFQGVQKAVAKS